MCKFVVLALSLCSILFKLTDCALSYDQRQTGDLNVQIGLKNIHLIALLKGGTQEYVDYDYAYDYSEMTIKPQHGTTLKPSYVTNMPITSAANITDSNVTATDIRINGTESSNYVTFFDGNTTTESVLAANQTAEFEFTHSSSITSTQKIFDGLTSELPETLQITSASPVVSTKCKRGFVQNSQGKCEYKAHGTSNALRRIVKLAQKIKIGRGVEGT